MTQAPAIETRYYFAVREDGVPDNGLYYEYGSEAIRDARAERMRELVGLRVNTGTVSRLAGSIGRPAGTFTNPR